jgi:hypothetical protein
MLNLSYHKTLFIIVALLCLVPKLTHAQEVYDGQVINKVTELAIPGVTVILLKEKIATQTNERGYFNLTSENKILNDTLVFSSVGYKTFKLPVSAYQPQIFIMLQASTTQLNEVNIGNSKIKSVTLSKFSHYDLKNSGKSTLYYHYTQVITPRIALAKLFTAPNPNAILTNISLGRQDFPSSPTYAIRNKFTMFLVHVMMQDTITGTPAKILFTKSISLTDNSEWVDINMSDQLIIVPGNNFFIAIEWIQNPYNEIIGIDPSSKVKRLTKRGLQVLEDASEYRIYYQPFLVGYNNENNQKQAVLYTKVGENWRLAKEYRQLDVALSATVHY